MVWLRKKQVTMSTSRSQPQPRQARSDDYDESVVRLSDGYLYRWINDGRGGYYYILPPSEQRNDWDVRGEPTR